MTTLTACTAEDLLAAVPVVLGFEPRESVVMLTFGGSDTFHARSDLPAPAEVGEAVERLLAPALRHRVRRVVFILYADDRRLGRDLVRSLRREFRRAGIEVIDTLRAHQGRWFALGRSGVPLHGVPYDVSEHPFRVQAVFDGIVVQGSREDLVALLRPVPPAVASVRAALRRAVPSPPGEIVDLVGLRLEVGRFTDLELSRLLLGLAEDGGREPVLTTVTLDTAAAHTRLWTDAVQRSPEELVGAPCALLALTAWLGGQGALAWCAVDRCLEADPGNSLAPLVAEALVRAVPPSAWARVAG